MKRLLVLLAAIAGLARAEAPALLCVPSFENTNYRGSWFTYSDGQQCRWIQWLCVGKDEAHPTRLVTVSGRKDSITINTLLGRVRDVEQAGGDTRRIKMELMWKAYVTQEPDPVCVAEYSPVAAP